MRQALADRIEDKLGEMLDRVESLLKENRRQVLALAHALIPAACGIVPPNAQLMGGQRCRGSPPTDSGRWSTTISVPDREIGELLIRSPDDNNRGKLRDITLVPDPPRWKSSQARRTRSRSATASVAAAGSAASGWPLTPATSGQS